MGMSKQLREEIARQVRAALDASGHPLNEATQHKNPKYSAEYFEDYRSNLFGDISEEQHIEQYENGDGGELSDKDENPAHMKSIFSSSAMTFNLLGNNEIRVKDGNDNFTPGTYSIEYEKKLLTVNTPGGRQHPAHLDAFLLNGADAVFCEMKMTEWMRDNPGFLKLAYFEEKNYYFDTADGKDALAAFKTLRDSLCANMLEYKADDEYDTHRFEQYDAWQMYKHILGIYNMSSAVTKDTLATRQKDDVRLLPPLKKVVLANVVFEPPLNAFSDEKVRKEYRDLRIKEHGEFSIFKTCVEKSGIIAAFKKDCGFDFSLELLTAADFMDCFDLGSRADYLQRYRLDKRTR